MSTQHARATRHRARDVTTATRGEPRGGTAPPRGGPRTGVRERLSVSRGTESETSNTPTGHVDRLIHTDRSFELRFTAFVYGLCS
jgi:hypothetical protein